MSVAVFTGRGCRQRIPRAVCRTSEFNEIFARATLAPRPGAGGVLRLDRGAGLGAAVGHPGRGRPWPAVDHGCPQRHGEAAQELPASTDAFVWLRLYQVETEELVPRGRRQPLWWTVRRPVRPLTYHAVHRMFERANSRAGTAATLHALRHTAAYRMAEDPPLPLTDVQFVLGHAQLTTTQIYLTPRKEDVIRRMLAHHAEQARQAAAAGGGRPSTGLPARDAGCAVRDGRVVTRS